MATVKEIAKILAESNGGQVVLQSGEVMNTNDFGQPGPEMVVMNVYAKKKERPIARHIEQGLKRLPERDGVNLTCISRETDLWLLTAWNRTHG